MSKDLQRAAPKTRKNLGFAISSAATPSERPLEGGNIFCPIFAPWRVPHLPHKGLIGNESQ
jgi:hypothetical protein